MTEDAEPPHGVGGGPALGRLFAGASGWVQTIDGLRFGFGKAGFENPQLVAWGATKA